MDAKGVEYLVNVRGAPATLVWGKSGRLASPFPFIHFRRAC